MGTAPATTKIKRLLTFKKIAIVQPSLPLQFCRLCLTSE